LTKKKEISFERYDNKISHFCHYFGISQRKPNCFWEILGGRICKKIGGLIDGLFRNFKIILRLAALKNAD
jgi:hypothetical protein